MWLLRSPVTVRARALPPNPVFSSLWQLCPQEQFSNTCFHLSLSKSSSQRINPHEISIQIWIHWIFTQCCRTQNEGSSAINFVENYFLIFFPSVSLQWDFPFEYDILSMELLAPTSPFSVCSFIKRNAVDVNSEVQG